MAGRRRRRCWRESSPAGSRRCRRGSARTRAARPDVCCTSGMPLHAGQSAVGRLESGDRRAGAGGQGRESGRHGRDRVTVAHPDPQLSRYAGQQGSRRRDRGVGPAELAQPGPGDVPTQCASHGLEAVADAEGRHPGREQLRIDLRSSRRVDRLRAAGQDDRLRPARDDLGHRGGVRHDLGVDASLAHPPRDELRILGAEVENDDEVVVGLAHRWPLAGFGGQKSTGGREQALDR